MKTCLYCGEQYSRHPKEKPSAYRRRKYCGVPCKMKALADFNRGKKAHNNNRQERTCKNCDKVQMVPPAYADRPFCGRDCMAVWYTEHQRGENHWHWQGGITEDESRDSLYPGYKAWRKKVYRRDGYTCVECGENGSGSLVAHHVKPRETHPDLLLDVSNGATLCKGCHFEVHYG